MFTLKSSAILKTSQNQDLSQPLPFFVLAFFGLGCFFSHTKTANAEEIMGTQISSEACAQLQSVAALERSLSRTPEFFVKFNAVREQENNRPDLKFASTNSLGLAMELRRIQRATEAQKIADSSCTKNLMPEDIEKSLADSQAILLLIEQQAAAKIYMAEEEELNKRLVQEKSRLDAGLISLRDFDAFLEYRANIQSTYLGYKSSLQKKLPFAAESLADPALLTAEFAEAKRREQEIIRLRSRRATGDPWNFQIATGIQNNSLMDQKNKITTENKPFISAEVRINLGGIDFADFSSQEGINSAQKSARHQAILAQLEDFASAPTMWEEQRDIAKRRIAELIDREQKERATLGEAFTISNAQWQLRNTRVAWQAKEAAAAAKLESTKHWQRGKTQKESKLNESKSINTHMLKGKPANLKIWGQMYHVTSGEVTENKKNAPQEKSPSLNFVSAEALPFESSSSTLRVSKLVSEPSFIELKFKVKGLAEIPKPLASGADRQQIGVFLAGKNQCNLLYAMLRMEGNKAQPVVQMKQNAGKETHEQCGNEGYKNIPEDTVVSDPIPLDSGKVHTMSAKVTNQGLLEIKLNGKPVWKGKVEKDSLQLKEGLIGLRADNVAFSFDLNPK